MNPEEAECRQLSFWLNHNGIQHTHIANESKSTIWYRKKLKCLGLSPGFPDYLIYISKDQSIENRPLLIFIEMKRCKKILKNGKLSKENLASDEQKEWLECLKQVTDVDGKVCYGFEEAQTYLQSYLS